MHTLLSLPLALLLAFALSGPVQADPRFAQAAEMADDFNKEGATALLEAACAEKVETACLRLLGLYSTSYDDAIKVKARALAVTLCDDGDTVACREAAEMAGDGEGGDIDQKLQRRMLKKACEGGMYSSCTDFAYLADGGTGGPQEEAAARNALETACAKGDGENCLWAGDKARERYWADEQSEEERAAHHVEARRLFKRSCDLGNANGCARLARMMIDGEGGPQDRGGANGLLKAACFDYAFICNDYLKLQYKLP